MLLLGLLFGVATWSCSDGDGEQEFTVKDQLPQAAQTLINTYFTDYEIVRVIKNNDNPVWYEVEFRGGGDIKFNADGLWYEVEADRNRAVPQGFYPANIDTYVSTNYSGAYIEEIDRVPSGFKVDLNTDVDLLFNGNGDFISIQR